MAIKNHKIITINSTEARELDCRDKTRDVILIDKNGNYQRHDKVTGIVTTPKTNTIKAGTKVEIDDYIAEHNLIPASNSD